MDQPNQVPDGIPNFEPPKWKLPWKWIIIGLVVLFLIVSYVLGTRDINQPTDQSTQPGLPGLANNPDGGEPATDSTTAANAPSSSPSSGAASTTSSASSGTSAPAATSTTTAAPQSSGSSSSGSSASSPTVKTISASAPTLTLKEDRNCRSLAPADWSIVSSTQSDGVDITKSDFSQYAGWLITSIDRSLEAFYGPTYGDPETSILTILNGVILPGLKVAGDGDYAGAADESGYFTIRKVASSQMAGVVFYHIYPNPDTAISYIESVYFALAKKSLGTAGQAVPFGVANSIRCTVTLRPPSSSGGDGAGTSKSSDAADETKKSTYNKELGTEYVHDSSTGENYLVSPSTDFSSTGPQGSGYYKQVGNDYVKLQDGRSDY